MEKIELSERKKVILRSVIDDYIKTALPISSKNIKQKYLPEYSTATIRNELATLKDLGLLLQPHTSSGSVPTQMAYRLYIDELMDKKPLSKGELEYIDKYFETQIDTIESVVKKSAKIISDLTHYTAIVIPTNKEQVIKSIKLVAISPRSALVIIVTDRAVIKDSQIRLPQNMDEQALKSAEEILNRYFARKKVRELKTITNIEIDEGLDYIRDIFKEVLTVFWKIADASEVVLEGSSKIFDYPEYSDMGKAKKLINILETKDTLVDVLEDADDIEVSVHIGKETNLGEAGGCSIVSAKYTVNGKEIGSAGVIGPMRMDYDKVISVLDYISRAINRINGETEN